MRGKQVRLILTLSVLVLSIFLVFYPFSQDSKLNQLKTDTFGSLGGALFRNMTLGLDIVGGARLDYLPQSDNVTDQQIQNAISVIRNRLDSKGYTEASVTKVGSGKNTRIRVEIPQLKNLDAAEGLVGKKGLMYFAEVLKVSATKDIQPTRPTDSWKYDKQRSEWVLVRSRFDGVDKNESSLYTLKGDQVSDASVSYSQRNGGFVVNLSFKPLGSSILAEITRKYIHKQMAIVLDDNVIMNAVINDEILDGRALISGNFKRDEAETLAVLIKGGSLPFALNLVEKRVVGASLGTDMIKKSMWAAGVGLLLVLIYMFFLYPNSMGLVADISLIFNGLLLFAVMSVTKSILTLPGIAGIILTIGMTVDGNIIIFERIKEEMRMGKTVQASIDSGYSKALSTIVDANITTIIAAVALYYFGSGTVKGFAITLMIGILGAMFTSLVVSKTFLDPLHLFIKNKYVQKEGEK
jgi:protein-export membrane protein SecD